MTDPPLLRRLTEQLAGAGRTDPRTLAMSLLIERGHLRSDGTLTVKGQERQDLGAAGRARDRAAKRAGRSPGEYAYNPRTNRATLVTFDEETMMPLKKGTSKATRKENIKEMIAGGHEPKQAVAASYRQQRDSKKDMPATRKGKTK